MTNIKIISNPVKDEWQEVMNASIQCNPNQSWEWGELYTKLCNSKPIRLLAYMDEKPVGILQGHMWHIGPICMQCISGDNGSGGGPVIRSSIGKNEKKQVQNELVQAYFHEAKQKKSLRTTFYGALNLTYDVPYNYAQQHTPVALLPRDAEIMLQDHIEQKTRNQIRKAEKNGVTVRKGTKQDINFYQKIQKELVDEKHLSKQHLNTVVDLEILWDTLTENQKTLWIAEKEGKIVGGVLMLFGHNSMLYKSGVVNRKGRDSYASNLLQWYAIQDAITRNITEYNLGGGTADENDPLYGITKFKLSFGAKIQPFGRYSTVGNAWVRFIVYKVRKLLGKNEWFPTIVYP